MSGLLRRYLSISPGSSIYSKIPELSSVFNLNNQIIFNTSHLAGDLAKQTTSDEIRLQLQNLSQEQTELFNILKSGENVYFTGKAGSGKTEVLKIFIKYLRLNKVKLGVTAPTGVAASLLEGQTLHSFSSLPINLYQFDVDSFCHYVRSKRAIFKRYTETSCIIIDEVSMVSADFFDAFNQVCKKLRKNQMPFGGIQIVMTGDFFQLPPVLKPSIQTESFSSFHQNLSLKTTKNSSPITYHPRYSAYLQHKHGNSYKKEVHFGTACRMEEDSHAKYLFHSKSWLDLILNQLKIRELTHSFRQMDPLFVSVLDDLRFGVHSPDLWDFLDGFRQRHLHWAPSNIEPTFLSPYRLATARYNSKKLLQIPKKVFSYESIDSVKLNEPVCSWKDTPSPFFLHPIFSSFSAQSLINLKVGAQVILLRNIDVKNNLANGSRGVVVAFENQYDNLTDRIQMLPVVLFSTGETYIVGYHDFQTRLDVDGITVQRRQIPLQLGWGMTIHRAQGMTLDKIIIDLPASFAPGHAYVAFSRVKTLQGLSLERFKKESLCASEKVEQFYTFFMTGRHQAKP